MKKKNVIEEPDNRNELDKLKELETDIAKEELGDGSTAINVQGMQLSRMTDLSSDEKFADVKQYPENPFSYFETSQVNIQLSSGHFHYEVNDFVLPGRDGFDLAITRRYDSGFANLVDMYPDNFHGQLRTGTIDNNHYNKAHGLGYGWSFVLPTIEAMPYPSDWEVIGGPGYTMTAIYYDYCLHLEDGRILNMHREEDKFIDYKLKDVTITTMHSADHYVEHPGTIPKVTKRYDIIINYKNGNKDYFARTYHPNNEYTTRFARIREKSFDFKLVAREDKFGNMIFFDLEDNGGMSIIDTWGRTIRLIKSEDTLTWTLPEQEKIVYHIGRGFNTVTRSSTMWLSEVTGRSGAVTTYDYYDDTEYKGYMTYNSDKYEWSAGYKLRPYMLLAKVTYPGGAFTQFDYGDLIKITNAVGGCIEHYPLAARKDVVNETAYNLTKYNYELADENKYIQYADVVTRGAIKERHEFLKEGLLYWKEVWNNGVRLSRSNYKYKNKLRISQNDQIFHKDGSHKLEKKITWEYSDDNKANVRKEAVTYPDDPASNQETNINYDKNNMITETTRKKDSNTEIKETNEYTDKKLTCRRIFEVAVSGESKTDYLKEKIKFEYQDSNNPNCVTKEKRYYLTGSGNLEQSAQCVETEYWYDSSKYTHNYVKKTQNGIKDADNNTYPSIKETFDYDAWGRLISKTDAKGRVSTLRYDSLGRVVEENMPSVNGQVATSLTEYDDPGNYIIKTDANHQKTRIQYTPLGKVSQICLAVGDTPAVGDIVLQDYRYNSWNELTEVNTYDGNGTAAGNIRKTERYTYDTLGRVKSREIEQIGYKEEYDYEDVYVDTTEGSETLYYREEKKIYGDNSAPEIVTQVYKDQRGLARKEFLAGNLVAMYEYDLAGNNIRHTNALKKVRTFEYDYAGRVIKSTCMDSGQARSVRTEYDALGCKRFSWDEANNQTEFRYDAAGRLIQTIAPFDHRDQTVKYYYDAVGNLTWEKKNCDNGWLEVQHVYDARNRLTDTYQYLSQDNWIRTNYQHDVMDRVTRMRTGDTPSGNGEQVITYTYNRFGDVLTMTDARGCKERCEYDKTGRLVKKIDRNGSQTVYQYDALNRLKKETVNANTANGMLVSEREYAYSKNGKRIREVSRETGEGGQSASLETRYYYDNKGQLIRQEDPGNAEKVYTYDLLGNRLSFRLSRQGQAAHDINLFYTYDDLYRLKQVRKDSSGNAVLAEYEYDARGNRKALRYPQTGMETCYTYNAGGRIVSLENKKQGAVTSAWSYGYDVDGNMLKKTCNTSNTGSAPFTITYHYDRLGRLTEEDRPGWKRVLYTYNAYSNRTRMTVQGKMKDELASVTSYEYGRNNLLEKEIKKQGKVTETYQYRYDNNGNEIFRIWEKTAPTPEYRGSVELSGSWKRKTPTVYEWRHYNGFHQLIRINQDEQEINYQYRGDGLRHGIDVRNLEKSQSKRKVLYWDGTNIVTEHAEGKSAKSYLRGIGLIARELDNVLCYYLLNEHGDVSELCKGNGVSKVSYEYDAFGNQKAPYKEDDNSFRYCGEYYDLSSSTYYLRARDYRTSIGRFVSEDPIRDGVNWYTYCINNPSRFTDPTGCFILLQGADYDQDYTLYLLSKLTDHELSMHSDGFVYISSYANEEDIKYENGNTLISRLIDDQHTCKIEANRGSKEMYTTHLSGSENPYNGNGIGVEIFYDPMWQPDNLTVDPITGNATAQTAEDHISLAHELIHADRAMRGEAIPYDKTSTYKYQVNTVEKYFIFPSWSWIEKKYQSQTRPQEELATVGLKHVKKGDITENHIRKEQGVNLRAAY